MSGNIQVRASLLTTINSPNLITGHPFEIAMRNELVSLGVVVSATGGFVSITVGSRLITPEYEPYIVSAATVLYPIIPDQMAFTFIRLAGERLVIAARNPSAGTLTFGVQAQLTDA